MCVIDPVESISSFGAMKSGRGERCVDLGRMTGLLHNLPGREAVDRVEFKFV